MKMTEEQKLQAKSLRGKRYSYRQIGKIFNVSRQRIHQIVTGYQSFATSTAGKSYKDLTLAKLRPFCELCEKDRATLGHHIDHNSKNNSQGNIMSLCKPCHVIIHSKSP